MTTKYCRHLTLLAFVRMPVTVRQLAGPRSSLARLHGVSGASRALTLVLSAVLPSG